MWHSIKKTNTANGAGVNRDNTHKKDNSVLIQLLTGALDKEEKATLEINRKGTQLSCAFKMW